MTRYEVSFYIEVDDELHAGVDEDTDPVGQPVSDWYGRDLVKAITDGVAEPDERSISAYTDGVAEPDERSISAYREGS